MMIIDHAATSLLLGSSFTEVRRNKKFLLLFCLAGLLPDALVLLYQPGDINYLYHRLYTNSILLMPFFVGILSAAILYFKLLEINFFRLYILLMVSWGLHILLDAFNPYGSQLFFPLSDKTFSLDILHSFDPAFLFISCFYLLFALFKRKFSKRLSILIGLSYASYLVFSILSYTHHQGKFVKAFEKENKSSELIDIVPMTFWRWRGILKDDEGTHVAESSSNLIHSYNNTAIKKYQNLSSCDVTLKKFFIYARYPIISESKEHIDLFNGIYSKKSYRLRKSIKRVCVDDSGTMTSFDLLDGFDLGR